MMMIEDAIKQMDDITNEWFAKAARGECSWVCPDCCCGFPDGMPDACAYGHAGCTELIQRDKATAAQAVKS